MLQYNAAPIVTGAIQRTYRDRIYQELGLLSLVDRRSSRKLIFFHKVILGLQPSYLQNYLTPYHNFRTYLTRSLTEKSTKTFSGRTKAFELSLFPHCIKEWENISKELRSIDSINTFKLSILNIARHRENSVFADHDINGLNLLTHLRLNFSHLNEHKFRHNFNHTMNPMCRAVKNTKQLYTTSCALIFIPYINQSS